MLFSSCVNWSNFHCLAELSHVMRGHKIKHMHEFQRQNGGYRQTAFCRAIKAYAMHMNTHARPEKTATREKGWVGIIEDAL